MTDDIQTIEQLLAAPFEKIEYAEVRLIRDDGRERISGRVVERWEHDLTLRYRGHDHTVSNADEWDLRRFQPVTSAGERRLIEAGWEP